jgi:AraC-like DNA-binding protein
LRKQQAAQLADLPTAVRRLLRKQMIIGASGMDDIAALLGMHRRTLDRYLQKHGVCFGELREDVRRQVAEQLLHDTRMQVQHIAAALQFSTAANFATAFRRWTGMTPSEYRRRGG